ncbi:MAG TPA: hypothetical protein VFX59_27290, partial [Polyangiales bacterium]|nr:hypothetical protein [Polyangiales bacterium]
MTDIVSEWEVVLERVRGAASAFGTAATEHELREQNARLLGPSGELTALMKRMKEVPGDKKRELGQRSNAVKQEIERSFADALAALARKLREAELNGPAID